MSEGNPERITAGSIADQVELWKQDVASKLTDPESLFAAAWLSHSMAEDGGDPRLIEEAEERLTGILAAFPELREQISDNK